MCLAEYFNRKLDLYSIKVDFIECGESQPHDEDDEDEIDEEE